MRLARAAGRRLLRALSHVTHNSDRPWAEAMIAEFEAIEGDQAALMWSLGSSLTLIRSFTSALLRGEVPLAHEMFGRSNPMFRIYVAICASFLSVLLLVTPVVRQGIGVTWDVLVSNPTDAAAHDFARIKADPRAKRDPDALAYLAINDANLVEADNFAAEASRLNPGMGWIYADLAQLHGTSPMAQRWAERAQQGDPTNGFVYLIEAASVPGVLPRLTMQNNPEWQSDMKAASTAEHYDNYLVRRLELQGRMVRRYGVGSLVSNASVVYQFPISAIVEARHYSEQLLASGSEADLWAVLLFNQRLLANANTDIEEAIAIPEIRKAAAKLEPILRGQGRIQEADLLKLQAAEIERRITAMSWQFYGVQTLFGGAAVHAMSAVVLGSGVVLAVSLVGTIAWSLRRKSESAWKLLAAISLSSLVTASAGVYVSFRPYQNIYEKFTGGTFQTRQIADIASLFEVHSIGFFVRPEVFRLWVWYGVVGMCLVGLLAIAFRQRPGAHSTA